MMFNIKKYKKFSQIKTFVYVFPHLRILKFKRPKWKLIQKKLKQIEKPRKKMNSISFLNNLYFNSASREQRFKKFYKNSLLLKKTMSIFFQSKFKISI